MTFNSWEFLIFYPVVLLLYFILPRRARWIMLLFASYFFYICYQAELVFLILGTTAVSWGASLIIERTERRWLRRTLLALSLVICLGVLFFYKYFNFLSWSIASIFGAGDSAPVLKLILPVGISFYTFQTLSYVIDVYRGDIKTERNFFFYALYVSFFPQLVAGPIERPQNLIPQLKEEHKWSTPDAVRGAKYMLLGFFKKICVADLLSGYVSSVYNSPGGAGGFAVAIATLLFAVQIYCDFSGYTDIATGCASIMGIKLMKNFDHPYLSTSIKEFWGRWHISLSSWLRDYLYIPLGGSRCRRARHIMNLMIVFLVSGLWHGAAWTFVIWGAIHGLYQIIGLLTRPLRDRLLCRVGLLPDSRPVRCVRTAVTFLLVSFAWIFFRAGSLSDAGVLVSALFTGWGTPASALSLMGLDLTGILMTVVSLGALVLLDRSVVYGDAPDGSDVLTADFSYITVLFAIVFSWALLLATDAGSTFIYFQF